MRQLIICKLGLLSRANPHLQLIALVILHLRKPEMRYDIGFSLGTSTKINVFCYPLLGLRSGVNDTQIAFIGYSLLGEH